VTIGNGVNSSGADGIAISKDGTVAFVYSQFDHRVDIVTTGNDGHDKGPDSKLVKSTSPIILAGDSLSSDVQTGRKLFFDAVDSRLSAPGTNVSCATCHLEGTNDQHTWGFPDGVRQTPSLAGRHLHDTAPYHWSGQFPDLVGFMTHTVTERMGGTGLGEDNLYLYVGNYVESLPAPFNPYKNSVGAQQVIAGAQAFSKAGCDTCHAGATFQDTKNHDVGTLVLSGAGDLDNGMVADMGFNVPSLLGAARAGPLLHSGVESNLEARVNDSNTMHGNTALLSAQEKIDLVAYLKTL
jgi:cytochrome c peroxidase